MKAWFIGKGKRATNTEVNIGYLRFINKAMRLHEAGKIESFGQAVKSGVP